MGGDSSGTAAALHRVRLYSKLLAKTVCWGGTQLYRTVTWQKHPLGWPAWQDWSVLAMRTLFEIGSYIHWRNFIKVTMVSEKVPQLEVTAVPGSTFGLDHCRRSWWVSLKPELQPANPKASIVLMYLHGGGFMAGHPLMYNPAYLLWMQQLAAQGIALRVLAVGYPLAPEHTFPQGLQGVVAAYDWLVQELGGSDSIILAGDSAGGNLVITSLAYMRDRSKGINPLAATTANGAVAATAAAAGEREQQAQPFHPPLAAIIISPACDFTASSVFAKGLTDSARKASSTAAGSGDGGSGSGDDGLFKWDYVCRREGSDVSKLYLPPPHDPAGLAHPLVSPIFMENFNGLWQRGLLVLVGGCEAMVPDIRRFVAKVKQVAPGLLVRHHEEKHEPHCYAVLDMSKLLDKGAAQLVPFMAEMATAGASSGTSKRGG